MKLRYLIPFLGLYFVWKDLPHTPEQYSYKPLQGDKAFIIILVAYIPTCITLMSILVKLK